MSDLASRVSDFLGALLGLRREERGSVLAFASSAAQEGASYVSYNAAAILAGTSVATALQEALRALETDPLVLAALSATVAGWLEQHPSLVTRVELGTSVEGRPLFALRIGTVAVEMEIPELGFAIEIGEVTLTECETVNQFLGSRTEPPQFTRGYGLVFGQTERKAISMALVDRALRWEELGEDYQGAPAQDEEFVLSHADNIQATGFLEHIKLPHYVDFQSELELVRKIRRTAEAAQTKEAAE